MAYNENRTNESNKQHIREKAEDAEIKAKEDAARMKSNTKEWERETEYHAKHAANVVKEKTHQAADKIKEKYEEGKDRMEEKMS